MKTLNEMMHMKLKTIDLKSKRLPEAKVPTHMPNNDMVKRVFAHTKHIDNFGFNRIKQQKGLNMWGDYDGDKIPNLLDCQPRNKHRQGPENNMPEVGSYSTGYTEPKQEENLQQFAPPTVNRNVRYMDKKYPAYQPPEKEEDPLHKVGRFVATRAKEKYANFKSDISRTENNSSIQYEGKEKAEKEIRKKAIEAEKKRYIREHQTPRYAGDKIVSGLRKGVGVMDSVVMTGAQSARYIGQSFAAQPSVRPAQYSGVGSRESHIINFLKAGRGQQTQVSGNNRILQILGKEPQQTDVIIPQPQAQQYPQQSDIQAPQSQEGNVMSPYSKRPVTYIRGKYRKSQ
jgi:hypothetical protein